MTEELFNEEMLSETCSGGCTCAGSVSGFAKPIGSCIKRKKGKKKSKKTESVDAILFKEFILNDMPCSTTIDEHSFKHFMNEGKWYMSVDNSLVNTHDKEVMIETFDDIVSGESVDNLLEDYSCYEMDLLMEDGDTKINEAYEKYKEFISKHSKYLSMSESEGSHLWFQKQVITEWVKKFPNSINEYTYLEEEKLTIANRVVGIYNPTTKQDDDSIKHKSQHQITDEMFEEGWTRYFIMDIDKRKLYVSALNRENVIKSYNYLKNKYKDMGIQLYVLDFYENDRPQTLYFDENEKRTCVESKELSIIHKLMEDGDVRTNPTSNKEDFAQAVGIETTIDLKDTMDEKYKSDVYNRITGNLDSNPLNPEGTTEPTEQSKQNTNEKVGKIFDNGKFEDCTILGMDKDTGKVKIKTKDGKDDEVFYNQIALDSIK